MAQEPTVLARVRLDRSEQFGFLRQNTISAPLFVRELARQALLIAARAEMQLPVADYALGEVVEPNDEQALELQMIPGRPNNHIQLRQGSKGRRLGLWQGEFSADHPWPAQREWVDRMELWSRTEFIEALEKTGFKRRAKPKAKNVAEPLDPALAAMIDDDLSFLSQFRAVRTLHEAIAVEGESRARLAGLVRAYAHLGLLTEYLWHPMSYVFKTRAVLYAQRWAARDKQSPLALEHRAYAFALVGLHALALEDLQAAAKLRKEKGEAETPAWLPLLDAYCHYDFDRLKELAGEPGKIKLAPLLYFLAHEHEGSRNLIVKVGLELAPRMPGCYRMLDTLCHHTGPGVGQLTTQAGPMHVAITLLPELTKVKELPPAVATALGEAKKAGAILSVEAEEENLGAEIEHRAKVIAALRAPSAENASKAEPDWRVLGHFIEETSFLQIYRLAFFMGQQIGLPADDILEGYGKVTAGHRCAAFLQQFSARPDGAKLAEAVKKFDANDNDYAQSLLWSHWPEEARGREISNSARSHNWSLPNELGLAARSYGPSIAVSFGPLSAISPHSPYAMSVALEPRPRQLDRGETDEERGYHEAAKRSPLLARKLGETWQRRRNPEKAERFFKLAAELDPSFENCMLLARHYQEQKDDAKWLAALEAYLETPNLGLQHAQVQCEIAGYYCQRREWDKALPYADAAGRTGAQWAMNWARTVNEANQNWDVAEEYYIAAIERYGESPLEWYSFCQRTGFGQLELAAKTAFPNGVQQLLKMPGVDKFQAASALYFEGQLKASQEAYEAALRETPGTFLEMLAVLAADRLDDTAQRDAHLKKASEQSDLKPTEAETRPIRPELMELAKRLIADLAGGGKCDFNFDELHAICDRGPEVGRGGFNYFLACYLDLRGKKELAIEYWKRCMGLPSELNLASVSRTGAGFELQKRGVKPSDWKPLLFAKSPPAK